MSAATPDPLPRDLQARLGPAAAGLGPFRGRIQYHPEVGSTNDVAAALARDGAPEGTTVVAGAQTAGRGRRGRSWFSPPGAGLYVSVVLRPDRYGAGGAAGLPLLTIMAGVALAEALTASSGLAVEIKWPNDLVRRQAHAPSFGRARKLAGILAETASSGSAPEYVTLGFGINVGAVRFPAELADRATSLEAETGRPVPRATVAVAALTALAHRYGDLMSGRRDQIRARWRELAPAADGETVRWMEDGAERVGVTAGIDAEGALLVRTPAGSARLLAGEVEWI